MFTAGKPGFLATEDLVLYAAGLRKVTVDGAAFAALYLHRSADNAGHVIVVNGIKPNGVAYGPVNPVWVAAGAVWKLTVPVADYMAGVWFFTITNSSELDTLPEYLAVEWGGVYGALCVDAGSAATDAAAGAVDAAAAAADAAAVLAATPGIAGDAATAAAEATAAAADAATAAAQATAAAADAATAKTNAADAKTSADTAGTKADAAKASADLAKTSADTAGTKADAAKASADTAGTKADAAKASADLALAQATTAAAQSTTAATQSTTAATQATLARKLKQNRLKIDTAARTQILYDDDGTTPLKTWALKDENGDPTATRIFERGAPV
ncbi:hypothetical protein [Zavarzinia sp.]|jgi:hypothetical protein|uniref:hypothetical protein n=1 Tax=Zavarzinia sp. TaxID=2027920 RepID=UPI00356A114C